MRSQIDNLVCKYLDYRYTFYGRAGLDRVLDARAGAPRYFIRGMDDSQKEIVFEELYEVVDFFTDDVAPIFVSCHRGTIDLLSKLEEGMDLNIYSTEIDLWMLVHINTDCIIYGGENDDASSFFILDSTVEGRGSYIIMNKDEGEYIDIKARGLILGGIFLVQNPDLEYHINNVVTREFSDLFVDLLPADHVLLNQNEDLVIAMTMIDTVTTWKEFKDVLWQLDLVAVPSFFISEDGEYYE